MTAPRVQEVDLLRSVALYGICLANIPYLALPFEALVVPPGGGVDRLAAVAAAALVHGKFFVLFSFLFGWGFGVQLASAARRGTDARGPFLRRLGGLAMIGAAHAALVFFGDILILYAILGLGLWALRDASDRTLMRIAAGSVALAALVYAGIGAALALAPDTLAAQTGPGYLGGFGAAVAQRVADWTTAFPSVLAFNGPLAIGAFALGYLGHRRGLLLPGSAGFARLERALPWLLAVAIPANAAYAAAATVPGLSPGLAAAGWACLALGSPTLAAVWFWATVRLARRLGPSRHPGAGRVSLSAYVLQGVIAGLLFNGYGLGLHGQIGLAGLVAVALGVALATDLLLRLWLRLARTGPLEALLRRLTYGAAGRPA
ncbi:DUF418 domain-containing protein [Roseicyclus persicicus]|uniref:DUF418 domain-containing protein n=1 Tax=Roseicyclus persicicus TaxID=2650661 RepID=A0A7X6GWT0_9RHOB|nr:DUF418 domain-containing protein [Roseibacterium persicicum]NKX43851.1 DUF418 domain-containing protein [Roseibacterium persicicum]